MSGKPKFEIRANRLKGLVLLTLLVLGILFYSMNLIASYQSGNPYFATETKLVTLVSVIAQIMNVDFIWGVVVLSFCTFFGLVGFLAFSIFTLRNKAIITFDESKLVFGSKTFLYSEIDHLVFLKTADGVGKLRIVFNNTRQKPENVVLFHTKYNTFSDLSKISSFVTFRDESE